MAKFTTKGESSYDPNDTDQYRKRHNLRDYKDVPVDSYNYRDKYGDNPDFGPNPLEGSAFHDWFKDQQEKHHLGYDDKKGGRS